MSGRWVPPNSDRVPINIHPDARDALRRILWTAEMQGVGYSEFVMRAVVAAERGGLPPVPREVVAMEGKDRP